MFRRLTWTSAHDEELEGGGYFSTEVVDMAEGRASRDGGTPENNARLILPWHSFSSFMPLSLLSCRVCQDYQASPGQQVTLAGRCSDHNPLKKTTLLRILPQQCHVCHHNCQEYTMHMFYLTVKYITFTHSNSFLSVFSSYEAIWHIFPHILAFVIYDSGYSSSNLFCFRDWLDQKVTQVLKVSV